jgi:hypothetical protein
MIILTCANAEFSRWNDFVPKKFSYKGLILKTVAEAERNGYVPVVYDLGSLGIGKPFYINDKTFQEKGYYEQSPEKGYTSKALFKPEMVKSCLSQYNDLIVYLDGDAQLIDGIDEVNTDDYDIGVTLREPSELLSEWHQEHFEVVKYVNAGVIFFQNTEATKRFVDVWELLTRKVGNDQKALNELTCPEYYPKVYSVIRLNGVRVKFFPCRKYNYYYFDEGLVPGIKIYHFKGSIRHIYPINFKKKLFYMTLVRVKFIILFLMKKVFGLSDRDVNGQSTE